MKNFRRWSIFASWRDSIPMSRMMKPTIYNPAKEGDRHLCMRSSSYSARPYMFACCSSLTKRANGWCTLHYIHLGEGWINTIDYFECMYIIVSGGWRVNCCTVILTNKCACIHPHCACWFLFYLLERTSFSRRLFQRCQGWSVGSLQYPAWETFNNYTRKRLEEYVHLTD